MSFLSRHSVMLLAMLAPMMWGSTFIITSQLLPPDAPIVASVVRALPAGLLLVLLTRQWLPANWFWKVLILGVLNIGFFFVCLFYAAYVMPGGLAAILIATQPLWSILLAAVLLAERLTWMSLAQTGLGILGVLLLVGDSYGSVNSVGIAVALLGAISMSTGVVLTKKWGMPANMTPIGMTGWQLLLGGLVLVPVMLFFEGLPPALTLPQSVGYLYLAIPGAMISYCLWFSALERLPTRRVVVLGFISPLTASALGYVLLNETFSPLQLIGAGLIALTLFLPLILTTFLAKPSSLSGKENASMASAQEGIALTEATTERVGSRN